MVVRSLKSVDEGVHLLRGGSCAEGVTAVQVVDVVAQASVVGLLGGEPVIHAVEEGRLDLFRRHAALAADHGGKGALEGFDEVRALAHLLRTSGASGGDGVEHQAGEARHVERLAAEGDHAGDGGGQTVHVDVHPGRGVLQGVEDGNAGEHVASLGVDVDVDVRVALLELHELSDHGLRVDAVLPADLAIEHQRGTGRSEDHHVEKLVSLVEHKQNFW